jgi:hypothetical protein
VFFLFAAVRFVPSGNDIFIEAFVKLLFLDLSDNPLSGAMTYIIPALISSLNISATHFLWDLSSLGALDPWLAPDLSTYSHAGTDRFSCPLLKGTMQDMQVYADPAFTSYSGCRCDSGYFPNPAPPNCEPWPDLVSANTSSGSATDGLLSGRVRKGMDSQWLLAPQLPSGNQVMVIEIQMKLFPVESSTDYLLYVFDGSTLTSPRIWSFSSMADGAITANKSVSIKVLGSAALVHFQSKAEQGNHFQLEYAASDVCPAGYVVQGSEAHARRCVVEITMWVPDEAASIAVISVFALLEFVCAGLLMLVTLRASIPSIKAASPFFLGTIIVGAMVILLLPLLSVVLPMSAELCQLFPAIGGFAFALSFGSLFAKTYRMFSSLI